MTTPIEPTTEIGDLDALESNLKKAVMDTPAEVEKSHTPPGGVQIRNDDTGLVPTDLPAKYQGKSISEVVEMHKNLESAYGRQANDLGTQRKLTDKLLDLKRTDDLAQNSPEIPDVSSSDLLDNPTQALNVYLDARDKASAESTEDRLAGMEATLAQQSFQNKHGDYVEITNDPAFAAWCSSSPLRSRYAQAAIAGNWTAADELLDEYKNDPTTQKVDASAQALEAAQQVGLTDSSASSGSAAGGGKQIYRRSDLIDLKLRRPRVYEDPQFQAEILLAYAEGRVK